MDETVKQIGVMTKDAFFHLENEEFIQYMHTAISSHNTWLGNLKKMIDSQSVTPLQLDSTKCGFGHFYYAITPGIPEIRTIWEGLGSKHKKFHQYGASAINALNSGSYSEARQIYREAENYSKNLIADMEKIIQLASA